MSIDTKSFLFLATTLAAGGAGGYYFRERAGPVVPPKPVDPLAAPPPPVSAAASAAPSASASVEPLDAGPVCDDSAGDPEPCPVAFAPSDEGVCMNWAAKRCADYKAAFKPKVAQAAVACLRKLVGAERCDPFRANLCGHKALMAACLDAPAPAKPSELDRQCQEIVKGCASSIPETTLADCHRTLSGMNAVGREAMVKCMKTHCTDKGLFGCEAVTQLPPRR